MSNLFEKLHNDRYMRQDGTPLYEYKAPSLLHDFYRNAVDKLAKVEFYAPVVASVAGAAYSLIGGNGFVSFESGLMNASSTFAISTCLGLAAAMLPEGMLDTQLRRLGIIHSYIDKRPSENDIYTEDQNAAGKMRRLHSIFAGIAIGGISLAGAKYGISAEFFGPAAGLIAAPLAFRSRYARVESGEWAFENFEGGPPRGRKMPDKERFDILAPERSYVLVPKRIMTPLL